jgi:hypothetical protein
MTPGTLLLQIFAELFSGGNFSDHAAMVCDSSTTACRISFRLHSEEVDMHAHTTKSPTLSFGNLYDNTVADRLPCADAGDETIVPPAYPSSPAVRALVPETWTDPLFQRWLIWYAKPQQLRTAARCTPTPTSQASES